MYVYVFWCIASIPSVQIYLHCCTLCGHLSILVKMCIHVVYIMYIYIYNTYKHVHVGLCVLACIKTCFCMHACLLACMHACEYVYVYLYMYTCAYTSLCIHIYMSSYVLPVSTLLFYICLRAQYVALYMWLTNSSKTMHGIPRKSAMDSALG